MKQPIKRALRGLVSPFITQRRGREGRRVRDQAHITWADELAQETRRRRLRQAIDSLEMAPYERDLLMQLGERGALDPDTDVNVITQMPPQMPSIPQYSGAVNGPALVAAAEAWARDQRPISLTADEYFALKAADRLDMTQLYIIKSTP